MSRPSVVPFWCSHGLYKFVVFLFCYHAVLVFYISEGKRDQLAMQHPRV